MAVPSIIVRFVRMSPVSKLPALRNSRRGISLIKCSEKLENAQKNHSFVLSREAKIAVRLILRVDYLRCRNHFSKIKFMNVKSSNGFRFVVKVDNLIQMSCIIAYYKTNIR